MAFVSINPFNGDVLAHVAGHTPQEVASALSRSACMAPIWREGGFAPRALLLREVARLLRERQGLYARLMALEVGKPMREARAEVLKCAWVCEFYAEQGAALLADELVASDARESRVIYEPLGTVLGIMPWNFPFWQVLRAVAPIVMAGNTFLLKHASNVPQCALALHELFRDAGAPEGVFATLLVGRVFFFFLLQVVALGHISATLQKEIPRMHLQGEQDVPLHFLSVCSEGQEPQRVRQYISISYCQ